MGQARCGLRQQVLSRLQAVASNNITMWVAGTQVSNWGLVWGEPVLYGGDNVTRRKGGESNGVCPGWSGDCEAMNYMFR